MESNMNKKNNLQTVIIIFLFIAIIIGGGVIFLGPKLHVPLILSSAFLAILKIRLGYNWQEIEEDMMWGIHKVIRVLLLFILIGMLMGIWIAGGPVPTIVYYSLQLIKPSIYLVSVYFIMSFISYSMGTAVGAAGTVGVAMMMVGTALGIPEAWGAGAIVSGAYFGDRTSPLSTTLNVTSAATGVEHSLLVKKLFMSIIPPWILTACIYYYLGLNLPTSLADTGFLTEFTAILITEISISPLLLLPPILLIFLSYKRIPLLVNVFSNIILSSVLAVAYQSMSLRELFTIMYSGFTSNTGTPLVDSLLSRGGIVTIQDFTVLCLLIGALAGLLEGGGLLNPLIEGLQHYLNKGLLYVSGMVTSILGNLLSGSQLFAIILTGTMFNPLYDHREINRVNLARSIADGGTITAPLIPWNLNGLFMTVLLGVSTFTYGPYAFICWITPFFSLFKSFFLLVRARI